MPEQQSVEWLGCPDGLRRSLAEHAAGLATLLQETLVGVYVHGSVARGCSNATTSGADVIVVLRNPCADETAGKLAALHGQSGIALDATFVTQSQLHYDTVPTPIEFVLKPAGECKLLSRRGSHSYFLLDRQDAYECSIALVGPPFSEIAPIVPWPLVADRLEHLLPHILPRFKNPALMLCRIAYAFARHEICSKRDAGHWALTALDAKWQPLIEEALSKYEQGLRDDSGETEELRALEQQCRSIIVQARGT